MPDASLADAVRKLYLANGDLLEAAIADGLVGRGVNPAQAQAAARECANRIWRNSLGTGAATAVVVGAVGTPLAGAMAGGSAATLAGITTFLRSDACQEVRRLSDLDVQWSVERLLEGR